MVARHDPKLGLFSKLIGLQYAPEDFDPLKSEWHIEPAIYTMPDNKRNAIFQAIDHLYHHSAKTSELVSLPLGAPFGTAAIDENKCTLCMACVGACPGKALQDGSNREVPEIFFIESNCIQCGTCTLTCPRRRHFNFAENDIRSRKKKSIASIESGCSVYLYQLR